MIERRLQRQLNRAALRFRHHRLLWACTAVWLTAVAAGGLLWLLNLKMGWYWPHSLAAWLAATCLAAVGCALFALFSPLDHRQVARRVESAHPELSACLLTAVEQRPTLPGGRFGFLQDRVIQLSLDHAYSHRWERALSARYLLFAHAVHLVSLLGLAGMIGALVTHLVPHQSSSVQAEAQAPLVAAGDFQVTVEPGDTEVERGSSLLVLARFAGMMPAEATLVYESSQEEKGRAVMAKSLDDPVFGGRIPEVTEPLTYSVAFADRRSQQYHVGVFEYPALKRADARLTFPDYTSLEDKIVQDVQRLSAVEGTRITLTCQLNKPVAAAQLVGADGRAIDLAAATDDPLAYSAAITLQESVRLKLKLKDDQGRENRQPPEFVFTAVPNKPPEIKLAQPARDVDVSPLEELDLKATARDDFGLRRLGLTYTRGDGKSTEVVLGESVPNNQRFDIQHLLAFESLEAQPDQLVSYHFWAEDTGPDGKARRALSDMYFAEVRPFDEVFRQGQQPPGGESQQQQQQQGGQPGGGSQQLAELQKQIINATWKLIRRETGEKPTEKFTEDIKLLVESQASALEQAGELGAEIEDPQALQHLQEIQKHMTDAFQRLTEARDRAGAQPLTPALTSETAAYQGLLKLRAREHQVVRTSSRSSQSSARRASPRAQRQLQQLELKNDQNRYETERRAQAQQEQQNQETRQVLNRLRELAQRQRDVNERLKELQSALQEARSETQRDELQRQLKRLREQQEELLRDTDELLDRMQQPDNQSRMADASQELQQTRENVRQASEALEQGMVPQAVTSGTRAQRELEQLRDEFRQQNSNQFADEMRNLRQAATELDQREQDVARKMNEIETPSNESRSLRDTGQREEVQKDLQEQQQRLGQLMDRMRQTISEAEEPQPLLADQLYDTFRQTQQRQPEKQLDSARRSLERGLVNDARQQESLAGDGIRQLREGVERAAESVLGDETQALRQAQNTVRELSRQLQQEIDRADPQDSGEQRAESEERQLQQETDRAEPQGAKDGGREDAPPSKDEAAGKGQAGKSRSPSEKGSARSTRPGGSPQERRQAPDNRMTQSEARQPQNGQPQDGQPQDGQPQGGQPQGGRQQQNGTRQQDGRQAGRQPGDPIGTDRANARPDGLGGFQRLIDEVSPRAGGPYYPLTGPDYREWSDRLRDVEEMVADPELRAEAARIRERARSVRLDMTRHSQPPNWDLVRMQIAKPLNELANRLTEELLKRTAKDALVPIDRDPVPPKYEEQVRRYYENLGRGQ